MFIHNSKYKCTFPDSYIPGTYNYKSKEPDPFPNQAPVALN